MTYEAVLLKPKGMSDSSSLPPLAVAPHGGPHVCYTSDFMVWPVCMAALGFAVLLGRLVLVNVAHYCSVRGACHGCVTPGTDPEKVRTCHIHTHSRQTKPF